MLKFLSRILLAVPVWLAYLIPMTLLIVLGFPIIGIALLFNSYTDTLDADGYRRTHWKTRWLWLYDNAEDGIDGDAIGGGEGAPTAWKNPEWVKDTEHWSVRERIFNWSAWRNSVGNARWLPFFGATVKPIDVMYYIPDVAEKLDAARVNQPRALPYTAWWEQYRKLGPYVARSGWKFELRFPWMGTVCDCIQDVQCPVKQPRFFWIGWRIAQCDAPTTGVGFAFQPWGKL